MLKPKEIIELFKKGMTIEAQQEIMVLSESVFELKEENLSLKAKVEKLKAAANLEKDVYFREPAYWRRMRWDEQNDTYEDGPFCQLCYDNNRKLIRMRRHQGDLHCLLCDTHYDEEV